MSKIAVVIQDGYEYNGMGRYAYGFGISNDVKIYYNKTLVDASMVVTEDIVVLVGFIDDHYKRYFPKHKIYLVYCSAPGQADMSSQDFIAVEINLLGVWLSMKRNGGIVDIITSSKPLADYFNLLYWPPYRRNFAGRMNWERVGYSLIGNNMRKHKNVLNSIMVATSIEPQDKIFVSNKVLYQAYQDTIGCSGEFVQQDNSTDEKYIENISRHKLLIQYDWSGSFGFLILEYGLCGVPCLCAPIFDWYPIPCLIAENPDDWSSGASAATSLLNDKVLYKNISYMLVEECRKINALYGDMLCEEINKIG